MVNVSTMMSTAHAKTAQTEKPQSHQPIPASARETGRKTPIGGAAFRMTACQHGFFAGLRQGFFVGTKPNGIFQKSMQIAHGKQVTHKKARGQKKPL
jgi:hypothetical protein